MTRDRSPEHRAPQPAEREGPEDTDGAPLQRIGRGHPVVEQQADDADGDVGDRKPQRPRAQRARVNRVINRITSYNVCYTKLLRELSVDLMRHTADAPEGTMACLFTELMLWGRSEGYRQFSLGRNNFV